MKPIDINKEVFALSREDAAAAYAAIHAVLCQLYDEDRGNFASTLSPITCALYEFLNLEED